MNRWRSPVHRWWLRYLLVALCCLPLLGTLHQVVHGSAASSRSSNTFAEPTSWRSADAAAMPVGARLLQLFSAHGSEADCRVFDQLSHGQPLPSVPVLAMPAALPDRGHVATPEAGPDAAPVQPQARGPPLTV